MKTKSIWVFATMAIMIFGLSVNALAEEGVTDTEIHIMQDALSGVSHSTITENTVQDGRKMTSRFREYATYKLENGKPVITHISGHTLLGHTTPQWPEE